MEDIKRQFDTETHPVTEELTDPTVRHEERDVSPKALTGFMIGTVLFGTVMFFGLWFLFNYFSAQEAKMSPPPTRGMGEYKDARELPPEPRLQTSEPLDLAAMHAAETNILTHYAWIDPAKGVARIPIDRAIDIMVRKGFPVRANAHIPNIQAESGGVSESGLGPAAARVGGPLGFSDHPGGSPAASGE